MLFIESRFFINHWRKILLNYNTVICHTDDLDDGSSIGFKQGNVNILVIKHRGRIYAYKNSCPHLGVELNWLEDQFLTKDKLFIQCFTHGALFVPETGECVTGPCLHQFLEPIEITINEHDQITI